MKKKVSLFLALMLAATTGHAELKVAYVNIGKVFEKSPQAAKAKTKLENEFSPREKSLSSQVKDIKALEEKMGRDASVMGEEERRRLEKEIYDKKRDATRLQQELGEDFSMRRNEELGNIQKLVAEVIRGLAKEEAYDLVLVEGVMFANDQIDITNKVLQKLESSAQ